MAFTNLEPTGVNTSANFTFANVTVNGNVTSGNANLGNAATANFFIGNGSLLTGIAGTYSNADVANYLPTYTGNVSANYFIGNGSLLTGIAGTYSNADVANYLPTYTGNVNANFLIGNGSTITSINGANVTGQVGNALVAGTVYTNAQPNITSVGTLSNLTVSGDSNVGNLLVSNNVLGNLIPSANVTYDLGTSSNRWRDLYLSGNSIYIGGAQIATSGTDIELTGNLSSGNADLGNLATANYFVGNGSLLTYTVGANVAGQVGNALIAGTVYTNAQPNITSVGTLQSTTISPNSNITLSGSLSQISGANLINANYITGTLTTSEQPNVTSVGILSNVSVSVLGSVSGANLVSAIYLQGTLTTALQPTITQVGTLSSLSVTGNVTAGNVLTNNLLYANGVAWSFGSTYSNTNVAAYLPTYTGNINANYIIGNGSTLTSLTGSNVTGQVGNSLIAGTVYTNAQPNITSVGTLSSLSVTANVSAGNILSDNLLYANGVAWSFGSTYSNTNVANYLPNYTGNIRADYVNVNYVYTDNLAYANGVPWNFGTAYSNTNVAAYLPTYTGNINANYLIGNGSTLTSITGSNVTGQVGNALIAGTVYTNAQPNITSLGTLSSLSVTGNISSGNSNLGNLTISNYFTGNGSLLSSLTGSNVTGQVANALVASTVYTNSQPNITSVGTLSGLSIVGNIDITGNINATGNLNYSNVNDLVVGDPLIYIGANNTGNLYDLGIVASYNDGTYEHTGLARDASDGVWKLFDSVVAEPTTTIDFANGTYASFKAGAIESTGNVSANYFIGNGSSLTSLTGSNVTGQVGNALLAGTVYTNAQPNITSLGTLSNVSITANASAGNILTDNLLYSNGVAWTFGSTYSNTNVAAYLPTYTGNITSGNISATGTIIGTAVTANYSMITAQTTGVYYPTFVSGNTSGNYTISSDIDFKYDVANNELTVGNITSGNGSGGTLSGANLVSANFIAGTILANSGSQPNITSLGTLQSTTLAANSNITLSGSTSQITGANLVSATYITGTLTTLAQPNITSVGTLSSLTVTSNISSGNSNLGNLAVANFFSGNGSLLTSITGGNVNGQVANALIAGTVYTNAQPNITSLGTLQSTTLAANSNISMSGVLSELTGANLVSATNLTGTLTTAAQPNITSLGTVSSLNVTANVSAGNILTDNLLYANGVAWNLSGSSYSNTNVAAYLPTYTGNVSANYFSGNGSLLTSITGGNISGQVANALIAGTVYTNAQPNITSVGTLSSLTVSGLLTATGTGVRASNIQDSSGTTTIVTRYNNVTGDVGMYGNLIIGTSGTGNVTAYNANLGNLVIGSFLQGTLTTAAQPNITSVGTLQSTTVAANSNITMSGTLSQLTGANLLSGTYLTGTLTTAAQPNITSLGTVSSLSVTANVSAGNILTNNLLYANGVAWSFGSSYSNTNVAAYLPTYTGIIGGTLSTAAQPNVTSLGTLQSTTLAANSNITLSGTLSQITGANLVSASLLSGTLTTAAQPNITSVGTLTSTTIAANSNITMSGTQSQLTGANLVSASLLSGTLTTAAQPNITSVGTLITVTHAVNTNIAMSGSLSQLTGANLLSASFLTGTLTTASQPNITTLGTLTSLSVSGNASVTGWITSQEFTETLTTLTGATGVVTHNLAGGMIFYHTSPSANFTANFTNVATTDARSITVTLIVVQGGTAYYPSAVQIDGAAQTIKWYNSTIPTPTASKTDFFSFNLIRVSSTWTVFGSAVNFG